MEKRKKKKTEVDKNAQTTKGVIERDLKSQNKKADDDFIELAVIDPRKVKFVVSVELNAIINTLYKQLSEYVAINNEYVNVKSLEEKTKAKRQKPNASDPKSDLCLLDLP